MNDKNDRPDEVARLNVEMTLFEGRPAITLTTLTTDGEWSAATIGLGQAAILIERVSTMVDVGTAITRAMNAMGLPRCEVQDCPSCAEVLDILTMACAGQGKREQAETKAKAEAQRELDRWPTATKGGES